MLLSLWPTAGVRRVLTHARRHLTAFTATDGVVHVPLAQARQTTAQALQNIGWDESDAALQAEIMTAAELSGNNQGLVKMYQPALMAPSPEAQKPVVERETASSAVLNGRQSPGMLAAITAADLSVQKLRDSTNDGSGVNIAIVSTYNTSTSSGQLGFYVNRMAQKGYVGIALCNSPEFVAAAPGAQGVFGTNPLAVGVPMPEGQPPFTVRTCRTSWGCTRMSMCVLTSAPVYIRSSGKGGRAY
jgi:LDH2 family malate/lactate/ureidoglycolate dehydrogenase